MSEYVREEIEVGLIHPWEVNPRQGQLREMEPFVEQLRREGIREDLHVWRDSQGVLRIMQGHRRHAAAREIGLRSVWCKVWDFSDEREAFMHLLTLQMGADPFDALELAVAARTAVGMGVAREDLIGAMHRSEERVQLYLDLGTLPDVTQRAVYDGRLPLETASLIRNLGDAERQREATQMVLHDPVSKEPMSAAQSRRVIEEQFLKPERWRKKWEGMVPKLRRKHSAGDGFQVVPFEDRHNYVQAEVGMPVAGYVLAEDHIEDSMLVNVKEPMTWGDLALAHGAGLWVCAAPNHADGYVIVCLRKMLLDAEEAKESGWLLKVRSWKAAQVSVGDGAGRESPPEREPERDEGLTLGDDDVASEPEPEVEDEPVDVDGMRHVMAVVIERLGTRPDAAMVDAAWKPIVSVLAEIAEERLPMEIYAELMTAMNGDAVKRKGLRWCLTLGVLLGVAADGVECEVVESCLTGMGVEISDGEEGEG